MDEMLPQQTEASQLSVSSSEFYFFQEMANPSERDILIANYPFQSLAELGVDNQLPPLPFRPKELDLGSSLFWLFLGVVLLWGTFYQTNYKTLQNIVLSFRSNVIFSQVLEERRTYNGIVSIGLFLVGLVILSTFAYHFIELMPGFGNNQFEGFSPIYVGVIGAVLISYHFLKAIVLWFSSLIFKTYDVFNAYNMLSINSIQVLGMVLFPIVVLLTYSYQINSKWLAIMGLLIIGFFFVYRLLRSFILGVKETNSQVFHIILYICALEILPLFVIGKLLLVNY